MPAPQPEKPYDYHFPKAGVHRSAAFGQQPTRQLPDGTFVRTTVRGVNVAGYDPITRRDRGGSRTGLTKLLAQRLSSVTSYAPTGQWIVQGLSVLSTTSGATPVQQSLSGRVVYLLGVSQGVVKWTLPGDTTWTATTNNSGETPALNPSGLVRSSPCNQLMFFVDGTNYCYFKPPTNSVELWTPTAGSLPRDTDGSGASLVATYRGRIALSGLPKDPQNIFFAAVADPFDFEYGTTPTTATMAVALNLSRLGLVGDVVTGLIPYTDDVMVVLCDHNVYALRGDPADGGSIDLVSDVTGGAFGEAWCKDPYGTIYFFGNRPSVWRMTPQSRPERISQPIEPLLAGVDTGNSVVRLVWNDRQQSVELYVTDADSPAAATHYTWEYRTNAWFQKVHAEDDHNPVAVCAFDGNEADDRSVLVGGWDGYVRYLDPAATSDDGTNIASEVWIGPIMTPVLDTMLLKELQFVMAESSGTITWEVMASTTAEAALAAAARASGTAAAGLNNTQPVRIADHAVYIKISATTRWAMESVRAVFGARGKVRRRN